jgi:hypothetical protein
VLAMELSWSSHVTCLKREKRAVIILSLTSTKRHERPFLPLLSFREPELELLCTVTSCVPSLLQAEAELRGGGRCVGAIQPPPGRPGRLRASSSSLLSLQPRTGSRICPRTQDRSTGHVSQYAVTFRMCTSLAFLGRGGPQGRRLVRSFLFGFG